MLIPYCVFHFELEASLSLGHNKLHIVYNSDQCCSGICSHFLQIEFVIFKGRHHETNFISKLFACQRKQCVIAFIKELWCMNPLMSWWSWITSHYRCVGMLRLHSHLLEALSNGIICPWHGIILIALCEGCIKDGKHFSVFLLSFLKNWVKNWDATWKSGMSHAKLQTSIYTTF